jgi:predicted branched-subunit amino acid permease
MFTIPVLLYQLLYIIVLWIASKKGKRILTIAFIICLLVTVTHLFFPPLMILQTVVIIFSYLHFLKKIREKKDKEKLSEIERKISG